MINLRLAKEYMADPIFRSDVDHMGHVEIDDLPISYELKADLRSWNNEYQSTFVSDDPPSSGFESPELSEKHIEKGRTLADRLRKELGPSYNLEYHP